MTSTDKSKSRKPSRSARNKATKDILVKAVDVCMQTLGGATGDDVAVLEHTLRTLTRLRNGVEAHL